MSKYQQFIFESYAFDRGMGKLELHYSLDDQLHFTEKYRFDFSFADYNPTVLNRAIQTLFFIAGTSYYKTYIPPEIVVRQGDIDAEAAAFYSRTYQQGLGEFWYVNDLDPRTPVTFPVTANTITPLEASTSTGVIVGLGGGKDSLFTIELLRGTGVDVATWSLNHRPQLTPLAERTGLPHYWVEREWDPRLFELNKQDAYNGHIPISAIFASIGTIVAILSGRRDIIVSNEQSANEATLEYRGVSINHQYSKSQPFERDFQRHLQRIFGSSLRYYSFLRPLSEVHIARAFAEIGFDKYHDVFSSCNRAFVHGSNHLFWDGTCSKCAFVFLALTPFVAREKLEALFDGKNLLLEPNLTGTYRQLLGIEGDKPLECVGEVKESRAAMRLAIKIYPELATKYTFEIPENYDYQFLYSHEMPKEMFATFMRRLHQIEPDSQPPAQPE